MSSRREIRGLSRLAVLLIVIGVVVGCDDEPTPDADTDGDVGGDADSDGDGDADGDTDSDADADEEPVDGDVAGDADRDDLGDGDLDSDLEPDAESDVEPEGVIVGPEGGTVVVGDMELEIPPGALEEPVDIVIDPDVEVPGAANLLGAVPPLAVFGLRPDGLRLATPATLRLILDEEAPEGVLVQHWRFGETSDDFGPDGDVTFPDGGRLRAEVLVESFSAHIVFSNDGEERIINGSARVELETYGAAVFRRYFLRDFSRYFNTAQPDLVADGPPLIVSNSPELIVGHDDARHCPGFDADGELGTAPVVLMRDVVECEVSGTIAKARVFTHHVYHEALSLDTLSIAVVAATSKSALTATFASKSDVRRSNPLLAGVEAAHTFFQHIREEGYSTSSKTVEAGSVAELYRNSLVPAEALSSFMDVELSGAGACSGEVAVLALSKGQTVPATYDDLVALHHMERGEQFARDPVTGVERWRFAHVRGYFENRDRSCPADSPWEVPGNGSETWVAQLVHDESGGLPRLLNDCEDGRVTKGRSERCSPPDERLDSDPNATPQNGNYGVHYRLTYKLSRTEEEAEGLPRKFHLLANTRGATKTVTPRGEVRYVDTTGLVFRVSSEGTGDYRTMLLGTSDVPKSNWGWVLSTIELPAGVTEESFVVELSPPGGANLPIALILLPANIVAGVEVRDGDDPVRDEWAPARLDQLRFHVRFNYAVSRRDLEDHPVEIQDREGRVVTSAIFESGAPGDELFEAVLAPEADLEACREYQLVLTADSIRKLGATYPADLLTLGPSPGAPGDPSRHVHLFATSRSFTLAGGGTPTRLIQVDDHLEVQLLHDDEPIETVYVDAAGATDGGRAPVDIEICTLEPLEEYRLRVIARDFTPDSCDTNCRGIGILTLFRDPSTTPRVLHGGVPFSCAMCPGMRFFDEVFDIWPAESE